MILPIVSRLRVRPHLQISETPHIKRQRVREGLRNDNLTPKELGHLAECDDCSLYFLRRKVEAELTENRRQWLVFH
jgi:hypothetical protein